MRELLDLPGPALFALMGLFYGATFLLLHGAAFWLPGRPIVRRWNGIVAPFFNAVAILFALLLGFLAADVADRNRQGHRALLAEADALTSLHMLSMTPGPDMSGIRTAAREYLRSAIQDEWPGLARSVTAAPTEQALATLLAEVANPAIATQAGQALHNAMLSASLRARTARSDRIALGGDRTNEIKWLTVLLLGVLTQAAIVLVHLDRPRASVGAVLLFTVAAVVTLSLVAMQEGPFSGAVQISAAPLQRTLDLLQAAR